MADWCVVCERPKATSIIDDEGSHCWRGYRGRDDRSPDGADCFRLGYERLSLARTGAALHTKAAHAECDLVACEVRTEILGLEHGLGTLRDELARAREEEREACAKAVEDTDVVRGGQHTYEPWEDAQATLGAAAKAIRARATDRQEAGNADAAWQSAVVGDGPAPQHGGAPDAPGGGGAGGADRSEQTLGGDLLGSRPEHTAGGRVGSTPAAIRARASQASPAEVCRCGVPRQKSDWEHDMPCSNPACARGTKADWWQDVMVEPPFPGEPPPASAGMIEAIYRRREIGNVPPDRRWLWVREARSTPAASPASSGQEVPAEALRDAERRAEAWRNTASEMLQIEIDHRGRERLRELFRATEALTRDAAASGRHLRPLADDLSLIIRAPFRDVTGEGEFLVAEPRNVAAGFSPVQPEQGKADAPAAAQEPEQGEARCTLMAGCLLPAGHEHEGRGCWDAEDQMLAGAPAQSEPDALRWARSDWPHNPNIPRFCNGCGGVLLIENLFVCDGCPCNSPGGINFKPQPCALCRTDLCTRPGHRLPELFGLPVVEQSSSATSARCGYLETILRRVRSNFPTQQEPTEQLLAAIDRALAPPATRKGE